MKHMREGVLIMIAVDKICMGLGFFFFFFLLGSGNILCAWYVLCNIEPVCRFTTRAYMYRRL